MVIADRMHKNNFVLIYSIVLAYQIALQIIQTKTISVKKLLKINLTFLLNNFVHTFVLTKLLNILVKQKWQQLKKTRQQKS